MRARAAKLVFTVIIIAAATTPVWAQQGLKEPEASPAASASQTVGMTEIRVNYHRPAINGRKVWGDLVPFGEVWRAGANENTTVTVSTPFKVGGKALPAGTYGLHMIPTTGKWTVIFSNMAVAWGSFSYDAKEDAARVTVTPQPVDASEERLSYRFDNPSPTGATLALRWEKLEVPVKLEVDTPAVVMTSMRNELRGLPKFSAVAWGQAAQYWLDHGGNIDEAQRMADQSIKMRPAFVNQWTRAAIAEKKGDDKLAAELRQKAMVVATENEINLFGYGLLGQKKVEAAIAMFQKNVVAHPESWNVHDSLGEALLVKGDKKAAVDAYAKALTLVKDEPNKKRIEQTLLKLKQ